ncbi:MAG: ATP-dependent zinc metalloprotease FtsH, partial [Chloroflexota bacterium]
MLITIAVVVLFVFAVSSGASGNIEQIAFSHVAALVAEGEVASIDVVGEQLLVTTQSGTRLNSVKEGSATLLNQLQEDYNVPAERTEALEISVRRPRNIGGTIFTLLTAILPILIIGGLILFMFRQSQGANNQAMSFGKSRARMFNGDRPSVTFEDVAGCEEAKLELAEVVEFLKEPEKFIQLGARIPKGVLMVGPPGTGKTLLSKAVAGEAGVPFFSISGSEFVEMFVGVGASRVRDLFDQAKRHSPSIIFIDEIDAVGRQRGAGLGGSHDEREQTLNQILVEMDGFDTDINVIIIAATNRPDILDPALMRPGRFDRRVVIDRPDVKGREEILGVHVRGKPLASDVDLSMLARATPGFVGADLENMVNEGAILAARKNKKTIGYGDLMEAIERVILGPERKSRVISQKERQITAYHEAGHAVVGHILEHADPVNKVTIIPRGMAGGVTLFLPDEEVAYVTRSRLRDQVVVALAGRAADEIVFVEITTGASNDIQRV